MARCGEVTRTRYVGDGTQSPRNDDGLSQVLARAPARTSRYAHNDSRRKGDVKAKDSPRHEKMPGRYSSESIVPSRLSGISGPGSSLERIASLQT